MFKSFLIRRGYIKNYSNFECNDLGYDLFCEKLFEIKKYIFDHSRTETELLSCGLKRSFDYLMQKFVRQNKRKDIFALMQYQKLSDSEITSFYDYYFSHLKSYKENSRSFYLTRQILGDRNKMQKYIHKIKKSEHLIRDIKGILNYQNPNKLNFRQKPIDLDCELLKREKYSIAHKINERLSNYENVLNQFNPVYDEGKIVRWMGIILRDLQMNPNTNISWNLLEVGKAIEMLSCYLEKSTD